MIDPIKQPEEIRDAVQYLNRLTRNARALGIKVTFEITEDDAVDLSSGLTGNPQIDVRMWREL